MTTSSDATSAGVPSNVTALVKTDTVGRAYLTILAFCLILESTVIGMMVPIGFPANLILFVIIAALTAWMFLKSDWMRAKLFELTKAFEDKSS